VGTGDVDEDLSSDVDTGVVDVDLKASADKEKINSGL